MRYISRLIIVGAVILASPWALRAQEHKRVEVTKNYTHEVGAATKIIVPTDINDDEVYDPDITYNINPETWQIELEDHNFDPASASFYDFNSAERLYTHFAIGYPLVSNAVVRYAMHNKRLGYFGVGVEHDGDFYKKMNALELLIPAEERSANTASRIPVKYRFNAAKYNELKRKGFRLEF
jgi:hypothetical protein